MRIKETHTHTLAHSLEHEQNKERRIQQNAKAKMDFAMKDLHSTPATAAMGDAVNVQHKKSFDIADVDTNEMKLEVIIRLH